MIEVYELIYENTDGEVKKRYNAIEEITSDFGLTKREVIAFYTSMKKPTFETVIKSISRISIEEEKPESNYLVIFD